MSRNSLIGVSIEDKTAFLQSAMLAAKNESTPDVFEADVQLRASHDEQIRNLILQRRSLIASNLPAVGKKAKRIYLGKAIQKNIRFGRAEVQTLKLQAVLSEFRDLKRIATILGSPSRSSITEARAKNGCIK